MCLLLAVPLALIGCQRQLPKSAVPAKQRELYERPDEIHSPKRAKELLIQGNERFVRGEVTEKEIGSGRRKELVEGQKPFACVVTCSDSRVPPELVFDVGLGDIFVVRVAGNVVDETALGSIEYAAEHLEVPLIVVMGHSGCGAVKAAVEGGEAPGSIAALVEQIQPAVDEAKGEGARGEGLIDEAVDINVHNAINVIEKSEVVHERFKKGETTVLGAKYELGSGEVVWLRD
ncbi:MAG: carbonic anhydrase [Actinobacteria bacterium]|nr:MAG: carbonic anhydrase [Actinomycetota bacterium]